MKIETIAGGLCATTLVYPHLAAKDDWRVVRISKADLEANPELCWQTWVNALRSLPAGFYTVIVATQPENHVQDIKVGKRGGIKVRPYDGKTITEQQRPCLRIEVEQPFALIGR
jgi:hypothetical protein